MMKDNTTPQNNEETAIELVHDLAHDLGIIDLDDRLEFTFDPLSNILVTRPAPAPTNGNCFLC